MIIQIINCIGQTSLNLCGSIGTFILFFVQTVRTLTSTKLRVTKLFEQMDRIGVNSLIITVITGIFAGAVLAVQSYKGFKQFGGEEFLGPVVALSMAREIGPVLTGFMVTARAGSAITAELGTMEITEQIDALKTLSINVFQYLIIPRVLAATIILPFLTLFSILFGILGGYVVSIKVLGLTTEQYTSGIKEMVEVYDVVGGMIKGSIFGLIMATVGCYKGYTTSGGARGVGMSTTQSVVLSSILIVIANYFLAVVLFGPLG
ncbi:MAG TPA: ABC transporter permease [Candidatus Babeliales bacterium]|nr:ABC transporter permease [Candidatus Babeliales bacterium]